MNSGSGADLILATGNRLWLDQERSTTTHLQFRAQLVLSYYPSWVSTTNAKWPKCWKMSAIDSKPPWTEFLAAEPAITSGLILSKSTATILEKRAAAMLTTAPTVNLNTTGQTPARSSPVARIGSTTPTSPTKKPKFPVATGAAPPGDS